MFRCHKFCDDNGKILHPMRNSYWDTLANTDPTEANRQMHPPTQTHTRQLSSKNICQDYCSTSVLQFLCMNQSFVIKFSLFHTLCLAEFSTTLKSAGTQQHITLITLKQCQIPPLQLVLTRLTLRTVRVVQGKAIGPAVLAGQIAGLSRAAALYRPAAV